MSRHHKAAHWSTTTARLRPAYAASVAAGMAVCGRCHTPILPGQKWDLGHVVALSTGMTTGQYQTEHALKRDCPAGGNRSAGGKLGAAKVHNARTQQTREQLRLPDV